MEGSKTDSGLKWNWKRK